MKSLLLTYARYHRWATEILVASTEPIPDADRKADAGLYFRSIHGTLNHLLLADRIWMSRFTGRWYPVDSLADELESDFARLAAALRAETTEWEPLLHLYTDDALARPFTYTNMRRIPVSIRLADALLHVFNHATHHRGQISAIVTRLGYPPPEMDLVDLARTPSRELS